MFTGNSPSESDRSSPSSLHLDVRAPSHTACVCIGTHAYVHIFVCLCIMLKCAFSVLSLHLNVNNSSIQQFLKEPRIGNVDLGGETVDFSH